MDRRPVILVALVIGVTLAGAGSAPAARLDTLTITPPPDMTVTADAVCGQANCAQVYFTFTVTGGTPPYNLICTPEGSGGYFLVGTHTVSCLAQDSEDDSTPYASFTLTVLPGGPPPPPPPPPPPTLSITPPADMTVTADSVCGASPCAQAFFTFTVSGGFPPYNLICTPLSSGGFFLVGTHTVSCLAQDSEGDSTPSASFTLTVDPPASGSTGGGSGSGGGAGGGGAPPAGGGGAPPSGGGGASPDTTAPTLAPHRNITVDATRPGGAVVTYVVAATDLDNTASQIAVVCTKSSGSLFPLGPQAATRATTVTCNAADPAENHATPISFKVTVLGVRDQLVALERELRASRSLSSARRATFLTMLLRAERYFAAGSRAGTRRQLRALRAQLAGLSAHVSRDRTVWVAATTRIIAVAG